MDDRRGGVASISVEVSACSMLQGNKNEVRVKGATSRVSDQDKSWVGCRKAGLGRLLEEMA